ncbi:MAG: hypothetical protein Q4D76_18935 [Oscillospiraceae bacterium]|nr:hypothetical protein [Oscillospiraceae bacterium]
MSVDASLTIDFESYSEKIFDVIKLFNESGWIFRNDEMEYLPNLDNDDTDWRSEKLSYTKLDEILSANQNSGKLTVVRLYDIYSDGVIELAASDTKEVSLWLDINRKHIEGERYTDVSWYILNIVGRINKQKNAIQHFIFDEFE